MKRLLELAGYKSQHLNEHRFDEPNYDDELHHHQSMVEHYQQLEHNDPADASHYHVMQKLHQTVADTLSNISRYRQRAEHGGPMPSSFFGSY